MPPTKRERKERQMNQAIDNRTSGTVWSRKALAACLMVVATLLAACLMLAAQPAHAATTFTVNDTADEGDVAALDGVCDVTRQLDGVCTLRAAIQQANATSGADTINFNISGTGVQTIHVNSDGLGALPKITEQVTIDGYTQPLAHPNTLAQGNDAALKIELDGTNAPSGSTGLEISTADSSVIRGLVVNRFTRGIAVGGDSVANRIEGNFVGTDPTGTLDRGNNFHAVQISNGPSQNVVGGTTPAARNILSGNDESNLVVSNSNGNQIIGNYVGTDKSGTKALGNGGNGVFLADAFGTVIGGTTASSRNVISGNNDSGINVSAGSQETKVLGNRIGTTANGTGALGNDGDGVFIGGSADNLVGNGTSAGSNTIAFNGGDGIAVSGSTANGNGISRNSIFSNRGLGIDLVGGVEDAAGNTANDPGDIDTGPNGLQNKPVISSAKSSSTKTTITGKLNSSPSSGYLIEFYSNPSGEEGKKFLGLTSVTTGANGQATFAFSPAARVPVGQTVTATAELGRVVVGEESGTSEFSTPRQVAKS
jgi:CSLREA domain-containing protein